nr:NADH dehydrogenase subunit 4L [Anaticola crassicornis]
MVYLLSFLVSFTKLLCSHKSMAVIISIEMLMASSFMIWLVTEVHYGQIYFYIMFFCFSVSEGVTGLSVVVSMFSYNSLMSCKFMFGKF